MSSFSRSCHRFVGTGFSLVLFAVLILFTAGQVLAQQTSADTRGPATASTTITPSTLSPAQVDAIVRAFAAKESRFRQALNSYAFKRDALVQTIGMGGQVTGEYHRVSFFTFDDSGNRFEKINFFPMPTLTEINITAQDLEDLGGVNPFALEANKLDAYSFKYVGKEKIDELDLYVFDVAPKIAPNPKKIKERFFQGRIWVDTQDLQIVKARGKGVPEDKKNKYATFETYREQIDGKYWFPTYTYSDDEITFDNGTVVRVRMMVKYTDFIVGRGKVTITEIGDAPAGSEKLETPKAESKPNSPAQPQKQPQPETTSEAEAVEPTEGGILNSKALNLPEPTYPAEARRVHAFGQVQVKVIVDETGKVISAEAVFGPESLKQAAVDAAKRARFAPRVVEGVTVKVVGILTYDFKE
ncbi:MAG TPA: TonB family protein [Pyrinomonadaceae bacterium]|nr:TonB family protein [Pyrinomonadaceae bacterium]